jgi:hypothetical protein
LGCASTATGSPAKRQSLKTIWPLVEEAIRKMREHGAPPPKEGYHVFVHPDRGVPEGADEFLIDGEHIPVRVVHSGIVPREEAYVSNVDFFNEFKWRPEFGSGLLLP